MTLLLSLRLIIDYCVTLTTTTCLRYFVLCYVTVTNCCVLRVLHSSLVTHRVMSICELDLWIYGFMELWEYGVVDSGRMIRFSIKMHSLLTLLIAHCWLLTVDCSLSMSCPRVRSAPAPTRATSHVAHSSHVVLCPCPAVSLRSDWPTLLRHCIVLRLRLRSTGRGRRSSWNAWHSYSFRFWSLCILFSYIAFWSFVLSFLLLCSMSVLHLLDRKSVV